MSRPAVLSPLLVLLAGCGLLGLDGRCGPESREVFLSVAESPVVSTGQVTVVERKGEPPRTLSWLLQSEQLRGRIESAALIHHGTGKLLMTIPVSSGADGFALIGSAFPYSGAVSFDEFIGLARSGQISLELETTLPTTPRLEFPLALVEYKPWSQPFCS